MPHAQDENQSQDSQNPLMLARKSRGLTRSEMALLIGRSYHSLAAAEASSFKLLRIPESWRAGLEKASFNFDEIQSAYLRWIDQQRADVHAKAGA